MSRNTPANSQRDHACDGDFDAATSVWRFNGSDRPSLGFGFQLAIRHRLLRDGYPFQEVFASLPPESVVQFAVHSEVRAPTQKLDAWAQTQTNRAHPELAAWAVGRRDFLEAAAQEGHAVDRYRPYLRDVRHFAFFNVPESPVDSREDPAQQPTAVEVTEECQRGLEKLGLRPVLLSKEDYENIERALNVPTMRPLPTRSKNLAEPDMRNPQKEACAEREAIVLAAICNPDVKTPFGAMLERSHGRQSAFNCPYWAFSVFHIKTLDATREALTADSSLGSKLRRRVGGVSTTQVPASVSRVLTSRRNGLPNYAVLASSGVTLFARPNEAKECVESAMAEARRIGHWLEQLRDSQGTAYWKPFMAQWEPSSPAPWVARLPHEAGYLGRFPGDAEVTPLAKGGIVLATHQGNLCSFNPWDNPRNFNFTVTGSAGSGKTTFARDLITSVLLEGGKVRLLDYFSFSGPFEEVLRPKVVPIQKARGFSLNPFTALATQERFWGSFDGIVELIVAMMYPLCEKTDRPPYVEPLVSYAVHLAWELSGANTELHHVQDQLLKHSGRQGLELAKLLEPFIAVEGEFANWFAGPRNLDDSAEFVAYPIHTHRWSPDRDPVLHEVITCALLLALFQDIAFDDTGAKQLVYIGGEDMFPAYGRGVIFEKLLRLAKNKNLSVGTESQGLDNLMTTRAGQLSVELSDTKVLFPQHSHTLDYITYNRLLDEEACELVKGVGHTSGLPSMYLRNSAGDEGVYHHILDPMSLTALTTNLRHIHAYHQVRAQGKSAADALREVCRLRASETKRH